MSLSPQKKVTIPAIFQQNNDAPRPGSVKAFKERLERGGAPGLPTRGSVKCIARSFSGSPTKRPGTGGYPVILGAEGKVGVPKQGGKVTDGCCEPAGKSSHPPAEAKPGQAAAEAKSEVATAEAKPEQAAAEAKPEQATAEAKPEQAGFAALGLDCRPEGWEPAMRPAALFPDARAVRKQPTTQFDLSGDESDGGVCCFWEESDGEVDFFPQATKSSSEFRAPPKIPGTHLAAPAVKDQQYIVTIAPAGITAFELLPADPPEQAASRAQPQVAEQLGKALSCEKVDLKAVSALGAGAFATVFQAVVETWNFDSDRVAPGDLIAVKVIDTSGSRGGRGAQVVQEAEIAMRLDHPNIAKAFGFVQIQARLMVYIEHIAGGTLERLLACYGAISETRARQMVREIVSGLEYLHGQQIYHRDLKPANTLLSTAGIKLVDFGTSKAGRCQTMVGTNLYMAPEVRGTTDYESGEDSYVGSAADIWSLGCTVIEILTGCRPVAVRHDLTVTNPLVPEAASADARDLLQSTVHKTPSKRPTATELLGHRWLVAAQ